MPRVRCVRRIFDATAMPRFSRHYTYSSDPSAETVPSSGRQSRRILRTPTAQVTVHPMVSTMCYVVGCMFVVVIVVVPLVLVALAVYVLREFVTRYVSQTGARRRHAANSHADAADPQIFLATAEVDDADHVSVAL